MKQINTATLGGRKKVEIDGHPYTVRRIGAGESLALNQTQRRLEVLAKKEEGGIRLQELLKKEEDGSISEQELLELPRLKPITEDEKDELLRLGSKFIDAMTSLFEDGVGGKKSKVLIESLSPDEIQAMNKAIWEDDATNKPNA